jgi:hypothetical protein
MTSAQGETAVTTSALVVTGLYAYRKATETITRAPKAQTGPFKAGFGSYVEAPLGVHELAPLGAWATGMGLTFIALSILTSINASFGGSFAILIATGAVLGNGKAVLADLKPHLAGGATFAGESSELEKLQGREPLEKVPGLGSVKLGRGEGLQPLQPLQSNHPPVK